MWARSGECRRKHVVPDRPPSATAALAPASASALLPAAHVRGLKAHTGLCTTHSVTMYKRSYFRVMSICAIPKSFPRLKYKDLYTNAVTQSVLVTWSACKISGEPGRVKAFSSSARARELASSASRGCSGRSLIQLSQEHTLTGHKHNVQSQPQCPFTSSGA